MLAWLWALCLLTLDSLCPVISFFLTDEVAAEQGKKSPLLLHLPL